MRFTLVVTGAALAAVCVLTGCSSSSPASSQDGSSTAATQPASTAQSAPSASRTGTFRGLNGKKVAGVANVSAASIMLTGFSSDAGPDLHVYLTVGTSEADVAAGKAIAKVSSDQATQTFTLSGIDVSRYTTVVIHCDKAKAVFGAATLNQ